MLNFHISEAKLRVVFFEYRQQRILAGVIPSLNRYQDGWDVLDGTMTRCQFERERVLQREQVAEFFNLKLHSSHTCVAKHTARKIVIGD